MIYLDANAKARFHCDKSHETMFLHCNRTGRKKYAARNICEPRIGHSHNYKNINDRVSLR